MKFTDLINEKVKSNSNSKEDLNTTNEAKTPKFSTVSKNYDKIIQDLSNGAFSSKWVTKAFEYDDDGEAIYQYAEAQFWNEMSDHIKGLIKISKEISKISEKIATDSSIYINSEAQKAIKKLKEATKILNSKEVLDFIDYIE